MSNDLIRLLEMVYQTCKTWVWRKINFLDDCSNWSNSQTWIGPLVYLSCFVSYWRIFRSCGDVTIARKGLKLRGCEEWFDIGSLWGSCYWKFLANSLTLIAFELIESLCNGKYAVGNMVIFIRDSGSREILILVLD